MGQEDIAPNGVGTPVGASGYTQLDIVGTVYHLVIHMQYNKIQEVFQ